MVATRFRFDCLVSARTAQFFFFSACHLHSHALRTAGVALACADDNLAISTVPNKSCASPDVTRGDVVQTFQEQPASSLGSTFLLAGSAAENPKHRNLWSSALLLARLTSHRISPHLFLSPSSKSSPNRSERFGPGAELSSVRHHMFRQTPSSPCQLFNSSSQSAQLWWFYACLCHRTSLTTSVYSLDSHAENTPLAC